MNSLRERQDIFETVYLLPIELIPLYMTKPPHNFPKSRRVIGLCIQINHQPLKVDVSEVISDLGFKFRALQVDQMEGYDVSGFSTDLQIPIAWSDAAAFVGRHMRNTRSHTTTLITFQSQRFDSSLRSMTRSKTP